jgi:hypothetical protein
MRNLYETKNITAEMVFAEQCLLAMCAAAKGIRIKPLLDIANLDTQRSFTHVWGFKRVLQIDQRERRMFCLDCTERIKRYFPEEIPRMKKIKSLKSYFE